MPEAPMTDEALRHGYGLAKSPLTGRYFLLVGATNGGKDAPVRGRYEWKMDIDAQVRACVDAENAGRKTL